MIAEFVATACAGVFAGAAVYINLVQHPAAASLGTATAVQFFRLMYARAAPMQVALVAVGSFAALWAWWSGRGWLWVLGAIVLGSVIPFTFIAIIPTNTRLKEPTLDIASAKAGNLLARWSSLHAVRSLAGITREVPPPTTLEARSASNAMTTAALVLLAALLGFIGWRREHAKARR